MPHRKRNSCTLFALLLLLSGLGAGNCLAADSESRLKQLQDNIASLRQQLKQQRMEYSQEEQLLAQSEEEMANISVTLAKIKEQLSEQSQRLKELELTQKEKAQRFEQTRKALAKQLRGAYIASYSHGQQPYLQLLLNMESTATVGRTLTYYRYFNQAQHQEIADLQTNITWLNELEESLLNEQKLTQALQTQEQEAKEALTQSNQRRKQALNALQKEMRAKSAKLQKYQENEKSLQALVKSLDSLTQQRQQQLPDSDAEVQAAPDTPPAAATVVATPPPPRKGVAFKQLRGKLDWPVTGKLLAKFNSKRDVGDLRWQGVVIDSRSGQNVRAVAAGEVVYADWFRGYGLLVIIDHGSGYMSLYGYNHLIYKTVGDRVGEGDVISAVGRSGGQDRDALYFEIRRNGKPTNPLPWLKR
ncbi:MAG: peptidoglycan DD-metalloendopeptidase family protein [Gammaproteobacteria bacterium]|nr:peptidoglycan DD-metalloendopeptidase family protein [Gammaproteobacteria bacterium]